ncbi:MAG: hypothetical protein JSU70_07160 [Phycisphaerales bacterium]|nr:MAG: hypothetical protein JSU70_07160 [Phycisphaerales bacterium]
MRSHLFLEFPVWVLLALVLVTESAVIADAPPVNYFTIPEQKLVHGELSASGWGAAVTQTDAFGETVLFAFSGLSASSTGVKDDYPVATLYGQVVPSHGNGDFSNFDGYALWVKNLDAGPVGFSLFINTGFTGRSGVPPSDPRNDTFWQSAWTEIPPGQARTIVLDFNNALPSNISDNPEPHTQGNNGQATAINEYDRTELSAIGFQIFADDNPDATVLVAPSQPPICLVELAADLNGDCKVDFADFTVMASAWLECTLDRQTTCF